jgi:NADP-dependent 3-hydroxy acid dehydrogenase YdfG
VKKTPVALITGATSGIGEATAYRLQSRGYTVFAVGRNREALNILQSRGLQARPLDITDEKAVAELVEEIDAKYGGVDVLVNNAGLGLSSPLEQVPLTGLRQIFETNVVAMLHLSQAVLPGMRARRAGTIINVGSTAGRWPSPCVGAYHITKYSVAALSQVLRAEVQQFGLRVVLIEPTGVRDTGFIDAQFPAATPDSGHDAYEKLKYHYAETTRALAENRFVTVDAEAVARAVVRAIEARNPKPRYIIGASGKASVLLRLLLTDRMWDRIMLKSLKV